MEPLSANARNVMECPFCKELVAKGAVRCRHCHSDLKTPKKIVKKPFIRGQFMMGVYIASAIWILLIILYIWKS